VVNAAPVQTHYGQNVVNGCQQPVQQPQQPNSNGHNGNHGSMSIFDAQQQQAQQQAPIYNQQPQGAALQVVGQAPVEENCDSQNQI
jgi:hypothetical protein